MEKKIFSTDLGIYLGSGKDEELFKWFLACLLFGKPIQREVARKAYFEFVREGLTSPERILDVGWDRLVEVLDRAHYVRFDYSTATKLIDVCKELKERYGTIGNLLKGAKDRSDLDRTLQEFKGIGPVTTRIFLRDIPAKWKRA